MSQNSKEWIKTRMATLKKQTGIAFNQDLFISILLCLISGRDKHLVLTAPQNRLSEVSQMAIQISKSLFGFSCAKMVCNEQHTREDLVNVLFSSREENDSTMERLNSSGLTPHRNNRSHDTSYTHQASHSVQTLESRASDRSQTNNSNRNVGLKPPHLADDVSTLISPVDFNLKMRERQPILVTRTSNSFSGQSTSYANTVSQKEIGHNKRGKTHWSEHDDTKRTYTTTTTSTRIAQTLVMQGLDMSNETIQAILLELIVTKELRISSVRYNVPKPLFLVIAVLPQGYNRLSITSQLLDHFFVSYNFEEEMFMQSTPLYQSLQHRSISSRRFTLMKYDEIKDLSERANRVHVNIDVTRYIRDIVVGIRTHPRVKGGLTARCSQDLVTVTKSLAALFERDFLTPELVTIAAEKVFSHRLRILEINTSDDQMEKEDMNPSTTSDIIGEILRVVYVPV
ncbi:hypothetical protein K501DRAFT_242865 [Backusella circina FSU 941]|nr:hypothetical protein K501DRAFT_242865 [Backusella circina FSU 941]